MKTKNLKPDNMVQIPESTLVALVVSQLKGKILFTEKVEAAKKYLKRIQKMSAI